MANQKAMPGGDNRTRTGRHSQSTHARHNPSEPTVRDAPAGLGRTAPGNAPSIPGEPNDDRLTRMAVPQTGSTRGTSGTGGAGIVGGLAARSDLDGPGPDVMGASTLSGDDVVNVAGEDLGTIKDIMLDVAHGQIAYAVLSFGGFLGIGDKLFAVPWQALTLDADNKRFILNVERQRLEKAPGFNKDNWPSMADPQWASQIHAYYGTRPYWH